MSRRRVILIGMVLGFVCVIAVLWSLSYPRDRSAQYRQLLSAQRLWTRLVRWQFSPSYRKISEATKVDPVRQLRQRIDRLESSLHQSGDLVSLTFWVPDLQARRNQVDAKVVGIMRSYPDQFWKWTITSDGRFNALCRPDLVARVQSVVCCDITNRVTREELRRLGGFRDEVACRLPDHSVVDLDGCQKWLNESIDEGWMVGVTLQSDRPGHSEIVATRRRAEAEAKTNSAANGIQPIGASE